MSESSGTGTINQYLRNTKNGGILAGALFSLPYPHVSYSLVFSQYAISLQAPIRWWAKACLLA